MTLVVTVTDWELITVSIFILVYNTSPDIAHAVNCTDQTSIDRLYPNLDNKSPMIDDMDMNSKPRKSEILKNLLEEGKYDREVRPTGNNGSGPVLVSVGLYIRSIDNIDDQKMEYAIQMSIRQEWIDPRIKYSQLENNIHYLNLASANKIWVPDLFFLNEKSGTLHQLMIPNVFTRIFPNGRVYQSYRITLTMSCVFDLRRFPMDKQSCPIHIDAYGMTAKDLLVEWRKEVPVEVFKKFNYNMARFVFKNYSLSESCMTLHSSENFSCIEMYLHFYRQLGFYFIQIYVPCALLVIVSWVSFWFEPTAVDARISLGITTILTIVSLTYGINQSVPPASYIKAIDVWTSFCQAMVFSATLQFSTVNYISRNKGTESKKLSVFAQLNTSTEIHMDVESEKIIARSHFRAKKIDIISRFIFPLIFILFNIVYWTAYIF